MNTESRIELLEQKLALAIGRIDLLEQQLRSGSSSGAERYQSHEHHKPHRKKGVGGMLGDLFD